MVDEEIKDVSDGPTTPRSIVTAGANRRSSKGKSQRATPDDSNVLSRPDGGRNQG